MGCPICVQWVLGGTCLLQIGDSTHFLSAKGSVKFRFMGYLPFIFKRRTGEEKQGDLFGFIVLKVCVTVETDICIGI